ncbi:phage head closure protein [Bacillus safensis]|uniref:phage head closure protein n=1 Tax=Bacillus safensis TaxID=561879 RepID=UPI0009BE5257|nr:phage head closure protein [Bacillus safensis]ARD57400.1 phage head-tail adapter protein [Bacillus safensis]
MKARDFDKRIELSKFTENVDEEGFPKKEWKSVLSVWAAVKTLQGREYNQAAAIQAERTARFVVRYSKKAKDLLYNRGTDRGTDLRIHFDGRIFDIQSVVNDNEQNATFTIVTKEVDV